MDESSEKIEPDPIGGITPPTAASLPTPSARPAIPRLAIIHLLIWTALTGLYLALAIELNIDERDFTLAASDFLQRPRSVGRDRLHACESPFAGAALGGVCLFIAWRRKYAFPAQPGEWLLVVMGADLAAQLTYAIVAKTGSVDPVGGVMLMTLIYAAFRVALYTLVLMRQTLAGPWGAFWVFLQFNTVVCCLSLPLAIWLAGLLIGDLRFRQERTWLHWVGGVTALWQLSFGSFAPSAWATLLILQGGPP